MVSIEINRQLWDSNAHWETGRYGDGVPLGDGEKWSRAWGNSQFQWFSTLLPRIHRALPARSIVEIGCGRGRWSQYLKDECGTLTLVDLSPNCIEYCKARFKDAEKVRYLANNGGSLVGIASGSCDFAFSFDSLVHADLDVMRAYLRELSRILIDRGTAFLHHSNLAACDPSRLGNPHLRDESVSAELVRREAAACGLQCRIQELVPWGAQDNDQRVYTDAFTTIVKSDQTYETTTLENDVLPKERHVAKWLSQHY